MIPGYEILNLKPIDFKTRFFKSLVAPWFFLMMGLLIFSSWKIPFLWIVTVLFFGIFVIMNYRAMKIFLSRIEFRNNNIEFSYLKFDNYEQTLIIPLNELTVDYFSNGKGVSSYVSHHIGIGSKGNILIKQFEMQGWTLELMKSTTDQLNELRKNKTIANIT